MTESVKSSDVRPSGTDLDNAGILSGNAGKSQIGNNNSLLDYCEEVVTSDSEDYAPPERLRFQTREFEHSLQSAGSSETITPSNMEETDKYSSITAGFSLNNIQIPIVGYEIIEERARFTVFKLRIENKACGDCWYVFRRYTDFVRLCKKLKHLNAQLLQHLPRKRWLGNNFDAEFLEQRANGLQSLVDTILADSELVNTQYVQDFFCLNEPPMYSETNEESRAIFEALEDTIFQLKQQIRDKENIIDDLHDSLHTKTTENENLRKVLHNSTINCSTCKRTYESITKNQTVPSKNN